MTIESLGELTLYVSDVDRCAEFYQAIGIDLFENEDSHLPHHFEGGFGTAAMQLYPMNEKRPITRVQLGFLVSDIAAAVTRLSELGYDWQCLLPGYVVTKDPEGNVVSLKQESLAG